MTGMVPSPPVEYASELLTFFAFFPSFFFRSQREPTDHAPRGVPDGRHRPVDAPEHLGGARRVPQGDRAADRGGAAVHGHGEHHHGHGQEARRQASRAREDQGLSCLSFLRTACFFFTDSRIRGCLGALAGSRAPGETPRPLERPHRARAAGPVF
jgi:hypothetical protein